MNTATPQKKQDTFQAMLQQLRNTFLDEMPEKLDRLGSLLLAMEKSGANGEAFNEVTVSSTASREAAELSDCISSPPSATRWKIC